MPEIKVTPLGAGQDVGRSCLLLSMGGKNIMLDCGMHMGFNDERRFPDFSYIVPEGPITSHIDCVIISHFHLDNCGALPYLTEIVGFNGPIYMTPPTKAISPILFEEMRKMKNINFCGRTNLITTQVIKNCMKKVTTIDLHQCIMVDKELEIKAYYAGHVLGAAMFRIKVGSQTVVYTGDFNMNPDRHLGAAWIDKCHPDLLITECSYAVVNPSPDNCRKDDFLEQVNGVMQKGGKVLIPIFFSGRSQEICILLESYWEKHDLKYPIYFATDSMTAKTNSFYHTFAEWTNIKNDPNNIELGGNTDFISKHTKAFNRGNILDSGPMVVVANGGMLQLGLALEIFKNWAHDENNMVILPDKCTKGTLGHKIASGAKEINLGYNNVLKVNIKVLQMNFDACADAKDVIELIKMCDPRRVILVHGEYNKMLKIQARIVNALNVDCRVPVIGETCVTYTPIKIPHNAKKFLENTLHMRNFSPHTPNPTQRPRLTGVLMIRNKHIVQMTIEEALSVLSPEVGPVTYGIKFKFYDPDTNWGTMNKLFIILKCKLMNWNIIVRNDRTIVIESVEVKLVKDEMDNSQLLLITWTDKHEDVCFYILDIFLRMS